MSKKALENKPPKFLFDLHVFDEEEIEEEVLEPPPPPPPTFTEAELEAACKQCREEGRQAGLKESKDSIEQKSLEILQRLTREIQPLAIAEKSRRDLYENEALRLCMAVFEKLFPALNEKHGLAELQAAVTSILSAQEAQKQILIFVSPEMQSPLQNCIENLKPKGFSGELTVVSDESLSIGSCKIAWAEGGAVRDPFTLAEKIKALVMQNLAAEPAKGHDDSKSGVEIEPSQPLQDTHT